MHSMQIFKILELLVGFGDDVVILMGRGKFQDLSEAAVDVDGAGDFCCCQKYRPSFIAETADKEGFSFLGVVLKEGGALTKIFLEGVPITNLGTKRGGKEVWHEVVKDYVK
jgi:hypothetical protein